MKKAHNAHYVKYDIRTSSGPRLARSGAKTSVIAAACIIFCSSLFVEIIARCASRNKAIKKMWNGYGNVFM
ncbi:MAG: hypothetical protein PW844_22235 [Pantoea sp.]|uniref:hypothetical protein n=1 Tax=Pantoea sp. TaxID=69393 RepID=UPI0023A5CBEF|nr:hypothetical protein [Pantoea sp.]MDE1189145.1 hypothetical protein [Pantoea sp.]